MSIDRLAISLAFRGLISNRGQTYLTMAVVAISVALIIFLGSLIGGLQKRLIENITGAIAHIEISPAVREPTGLWDRTVSVDDSDTLYLGESPRLMQREELIDSWSEWTEFIEGLSTSITAVSPSVAGQGFLTRGAQREAVLLSGVDYERHNRMVDIESNLVSGRFLELAPDEVALGLPLATEFALEEGDRVRLMSATGNIRSFSVAGIFDSGFNQIDTRTIFMSLRDAQSLFGYGSGATSIGIQIDDIFEAEKLATKLQQQVPFETKSWMEDNQQLLTALQAQSQSTLVILVFTTLAAGFAIASILVMLVVSKLREIGILKAMGATSGQVVGTFALQGTMMAFLGALLGLALGIGVSELTAQFRTDRGTQLFPIEITLQLVIVSVAVALTVGFIASILPARRAAKVDPIEVIRGA